MNTTVRLNDPCLENQKKMCKTDNLPVFVSSCSHDTPWTRTFDYQAPNRNLTDMLVFKLGDLSKALLYAASYHIISCPICNKSWCD